jgi:hypothetical protein
MYYFESITIVCICWVIVKKSTYNALNGKYKKPELYLNIQFVPHSKHSPVIKTNQLRLCKENRGLCSEIHTKHINTLCGQNVEFLNVKPGGTYSNHWDLKFCNSHISLVSPEIRLLVRSLNWNGVGRHQSAWLRRHKRRVKSDHHIYFSLHR